MAKTQEPDQIKGFLGLTSYYIKFVKNYGTIVRPLTNMTKNGGFNGMQIVRKPSKNSRLP